MQPGRDGCEMETDFARARARSEARDALWVSSRGDYVSSDARKGKICAREMLRGCLAG